MKEAYKEYLDEKKSSGIESMFSVLEEFEDLFGLTVPEALDIIGEWLEERRFTYEKD